MSLLQLGLFNAAVATALALLAAAVSWRGRPALAYGLWLLVLLKLVTPPLIPVPLRGPAPAAEASAVEEAPVPTCPANFGRALLVPAPADEPPVPTAAEPEAPASTWGAAEWALAAWAAGACALWLAAVWRITALRRLIARLPAAPPQAQARVAELAGRLGLRRAPTVRLLPDAKLPPLVVAPGWRAWLLLPEGLWARLDDAGRDAVLLHELAHLRRGDHRVRWLELLAVGLYWWLPVAWWARCRLRQAEEECCDAWVVWAAPAARPAYAAALVETVAFLSGPGAALPVGASGAGPVVALKRRLTMILHGRTQRGLSRLGWAVVLGGLAVLPLMPTLAGGQPAKEAPAKDSGAMTMERVLASKTCIACHDAPKKKEAGRAEAGEAHDSVVKLLDELKTQRDALKKTETALKDALDRFEKSTQPQPNEKPKGKTPREKELEERLEKLQKEVEALRREMRRGDARFGREGSPAVIAGKKYYSNTRKLNVPILWKEGTGAKQAALFVRRDGEKKYEMVKMVAAGTKSAAYTAPKDGTYSFYLFVPEGEDGARVRYDPPGSAALTVVFDTTPPVIELEHSGGRGMTPLSLKWTVTDENLQDNTVKLEVRKVNQTNWVDKTFSAAAKGSTTLLGEKDIAEFRLTAYDKAGNRVVSRHWVNRDD